MYEALLGETYAVTSYEEMIEAKQKAEEAKKQFHWRHKDYLITCLCNVGFAKSKVRVKKTGDIGVLVVEEKGYLSTHPYEIKFYPFTKSGDLSKKSRYVAQFNQMHEKDIIRELQNCFEKVEDSNAS